MRIHETMTVEEMADALYEERDHRAVSEFMMLLGRLFDDKKISSAAWTESIEVVSLASVAVMSGQRGQRMDIISDRMRISHILATADNSEAL